MTTLLVLAMVLLCMAIPAQAQTPATVEPTLQLHPHNVMSSTPCWTSEPWR